MDSNGILPMALACAVPLWIDRLRRETPAQRDARRERCLRIIAEHGDIILYKGTAKMDGQKITTADAFNALAEALAIMAFMPGGVTAFEQHWEVSNGETKATGPDTEGP